MTKAELEEKYHELLDLLNHKMNEIIPGEPGISEEKVNL